METREGKFNWESNICLARYLIISNITAGGSTNHISQGCRQYFRYKSQILLYMVIPVLPCIDLFSRHAGSLHKSKLGVSGGGAYFPLFWTVIRSYYPGHQRFFFP